jgi:hypothetical protein
MYETVSFSGSKVPGAGTWTVGVCTIGSSRFDQAWFSGYVMVTN